MADTDKPAPEKKKRQMTPEHLAKLAEARKKANEIRLAKQAEKREQKELEKKVKSLEDKKRLKELKDREAQLSQTVPPATQEEAVELKEEPKGKVVEIGVTKEQQQQLLEEEQTAKEVKRTVRKAKPRKKKVIYISDSSSSDEEEEKVVYVRRKGKKPPTVETPQQPAEKSMANEILRRSYQQEVDRARIDQMKQFFKPTCNWTR